MLLVAIAVFAGATVQSVTGFGFVLVVGPALFATLDPGQALTILFVVGSLVCALLLLSEGRERRIRSDHMRPVLIAAVPGALCGVLVLRALAKPTLQHRLIVNYRAEAEGMTPASVVDQLLDHLKP